MTAASDEQASGVAQINRAIARVDQVTQQNASAAEELSGTAEQLAEQARVLEQRMSFFKITSPEAPDAGTGRQAAGPAESSAVAAESPASAGAGRAVFQPEELDFKRF